MKDSLRTLIVGSLLIVSLFVLAWVNVHQSWVYYQQQEKIADLEQEQNDLYQENKRLLAHINELASPPQIMSLMQKHPEWGLHYLEPSEVILIYPSSSEGTQE